jgi:uncharacterized protein
MIEIIEQNRDKLIELCRRYNIRELAVFGSAVRGQLQSDSDVDLLVTFAPDADWSLFDHYRMEDEFSEIFHREVDLISRRAVEENPNWICRKEILDSARVIYAA